MTAERAANIEAHAYLTSQYRTLPRETQKRLIDDFRREQANGATMTWSSYIAAVMPLLPPDARR